MNLPVRIFRQAGMDEVKVTPVDSSAFPVKAKRPSNSRLNKEKLTENGFERLPAWQDALGPLFGRTEEKQHVFNQIKNPCFYCVKQ